MSSAPLSAAGLRRIAVAAAESAGGPLREAFRSGVTPETKSSHHDLVTAFDLSTESALRRELMRAAPGSTVLGEEGTTDPSGQIVTPASGALRAGSLSTGPPASARPREVQWIVDPIDGTSNFAHGFAFFSISIAAAVDGEVVAGVVHDPVTRQTFSADDAGAHLGRSGAGSREDGTTAALRDDDAPDRYGPQLNLVTSFPAAEILAGHRDAALDIYGDLVCAHSTVRRLVSGALELCYAAAGWADVVLGVDTKPWDIAAGMLILRRAGGTFLTAGGTDHHARHYLGLRAGVSAPAAEDALRRIAELTDPI